MIAAELGASQRPVAAVRSELIAQLSDMAKQLGVEINLNYLFLQQHKPDDERQG